MSKYSFEQWIKQNHPQITDTKRYPNTIQTISNHLNKSSIFSDNIFLIENPDVVKSLKELYFEVDEFYKLNKRGNNMYSRAFDLYIKYLQELEYLDQASIDIQEIIDNEEIGKTEKIALIQSRIGQGKFRDSLISIWAGCSVTGYRNVSLLIASHIKPWSKSNNFERIDPYNGFLLLPNLDKAFDLGLITFNDSGEICISNEFSEYDFLGVLKTMKILIKEKNRPYLAYHQTNVFCQ